MPPNDQQREDLDCLADFVLETVRTGKIDIVKGMKVGSPLKRQAGKVDAAVGHIMRRYCREDEKVNALIELAAQQSPAFASLAERFGLRVKEVEPEVKDAKPC